MDSNIFFCWLQGLENAPILVKNNYKTWVIKNPNWNVQLIDNNNINEFLDFDSLLGENKQYITYASLSDVIRVNLLNSYGGVWVDATTFCMQPLEYWLPQAMPGGFFCLGNKSPDRVIASYFIASEKNNLLINNWAKVTNNYWEAHIFSNQSRYKNIINLLSQELSNNHELTQEWFSYVVTKVLKIYPYFWFHYLFYRIVNNDVKCFDIWKSCINEKISGKPGIFLRQPDDLILTDELKTKIDSNFSPFYKFNHRKYDLQSKDNTVLYYLFSNYM